MTRVTVGNATEPAATAPRRPRWVAFGGLAYLVVSLVSSALYLVRIHPSLANDYWWPDFNSTGVQTFLGDVYNLHLSQSQRGTFPLFDSDSSVYSTKSYANNDTRIEWSASYGRQLLLDEIPLAMAVNGLRKLNLEVNLMMVAPYCWLDINRTFAMAHTFKRQRRCEATKQSNAGLYMETVTRNCAANSMYTTTQRQEINGTIFSTLRLTKEGQWWIQAMENHQELLPVDDEVAYWTSRGLTRWKTPMQNLNQDGIDDSIAIRNALGYEQTMHIKKLSTFGRSVGRWTTLAAYDGIWNDLYICHSIGASVLLDANNSLPNLGIDWDYDVYYPPNTVGANLVRQTIGPFLSIDVEWVGVPPILQAFHRAFQKQVAVIYNEDNKARLRVTYVDPIPASWRGSPYTLYYGGNPMCPFGEGQPYIQPSFGFYDDCTSQVRHSLRLTPEAALFAMHIMTPLGADKVLTSCQLCTNDTSDACASYLLDIQHNIHLDTEVASLELLQAARALDIAFIQLASDNGSSFVLSQPMVPSDTSDPWTMFGWVMMYDWLQGDREAYNFEGDHGNVTLLTQPHPVKFSMVANPTELRSHACKYIWYISVYVTFLLTGVGALIVLYALVYRFQFDGTHLLQFNRVAGAVWIGRPMLFLRGMTALVVLSTVPVTFVQSGGLSTLQWAPRSIVESCLLAGEGTWLTYVLQDIFSPMTHHAGWFVPTSSCVVWGVLLVLDQSRGLNVTSVIHPTCVLGQLGAQITCDSGVVEIGSSARFKLLWAICAVVPVTLWLVAWLLRTWKHTTPIVFSGNQVLAPAAATSYLHVDDGEKLEPVASVMCGLLHLPHDFSFDIKLWRKFRRTKFTSIMVENPPLLPSVPYKAVPVSNATSRLFGFACLGLVYMVSTVVASYTYLVVTQSTMTNDVWWASFNATGHQTFLTNWFSNQLLLSPALDATHIDQLQYGDVVNTYDSNQTSIMTAPMYPASIQDQVHSDLHAVVVGLRSTHSCDLPWIASSYCFVDFGQSWEMAVSAARQVKCKLDATNGALYLESILRNADWAIMEPCWGAALQRSVFDHVQSSSKGQQWVVAMTSLESKVPVPDEVAAWRSFNVTAYSPHWQNHKQMGIVETADIQNAFGLAYPLTIRKIAPEYQSSSPTSFRMQWPLASLLWAVGSTNTSGVAGHSLVRSSPEFAFSNESSVESLLVRNGTLPFPLDAGLALTRTTFGPFGTIAMKRIAPPLPLRVLYQNLTQAILISIGDNATALEVFSSIEILTMFTPDIAAWRELSHIGGNFMCSLGSHVEPKLSGLFPLDGSCATNEIEQTLDTKISSMAALLTQSTRPQTLIEHTCEHETFAKNSCKDALLQGVRFFESTMLPRQLLALVDLADATKHTIQSMYNPQIVQYTWDGQPQSNAALSHVGVFDEPTFEFFAWLYMFEWMLGYREVVQFDGAFASMTVVSGRPSNVMFEVNALEVPLNVAFYLRSALQYFTMVLLIVAFVVCLTILVNRGYIEGVNMFEFNRVAGLVWIGRPLMLLRGVTATCILSTATLHLVQPNNMHAGFTQLASSPPNAITTILSCGEMGWVVYILNDVFSVVTTDTTSRYAWKSSTSVWLAAGVWSLVSPVQHVVRIDRQCIVQQVDFALTCQSGVLEIGSVHRFAGLLVLAMVCCVGCFVLDRVCFARRGTAKRATSLLLHAVAQDQFDLRHWNHHGVYYLDRASAVLNGLLTFRTPSGTFVVMDVKAWQVLIIRPQDHHGGGSLPLAFSAALPLVD
ncbi:hypothetical protein DYB26_002843 [Aphanomyces astaci]|uniref:Uncharacterized protein n=2 Tax=Aphanomyces astaci TaxID=112090 RepID=A0A3R7ALJ2_APHAT|nr:hypothetical protein DYB26_002843 [Aphanomyces astaci]